MQTFRAFFAGIFGASILTMLMIVMRYFNLSSINLELTLGSLITMTLSPSSWSLGLMIHLLAGGLFGTFYGVGFEYGSSRSVLFKGVLFGILHGLISGICIGFMPLIHPLMISAADSTSFMLKPGFFVSHFGWATSVIFFILHLIFGVIMAAFYQPDELLSPEYPKLSKQGFV